MTSSNRKQAFQLSQNVERLVAAEFLAGGALGSLEDFRTPVEGLLVDLEAVDRLQDEVIRRFSPYDLECDIWLAPRFHNVVRLSRRQASNQGFWRWMSLEVMNRYVRHRWAEKGKVTAYRYLGGSNFLRRNAAARLWWGAEAVRNGADYRQVEAIFRSSGLEQYVLDSRFGHLRASALGFARVGMGKAGTRELKFEEMKELSKRANLLLSATALEGLANTGAAEFDVSSTAWLAEEPNVDIVIKQPISEIRGPASDAVTEDEIARYAAWYAEIAREIINSTEEPSTGGFAA
jgi:hypothetical protein